MTFFFKDILGIQIVKESYQRMEMIDILLKYILWYEFFSDLDAQSNFDKNCVAKKLVK